MPIFNSIKGALAMRNTTAAELSRLLPDANTEAIMSYITQGRVIPTKTDLQKACDILDCSPSDLYNMVDLDYSSIKKTPAKAFPKLDRNRDRSGRIWIDSGNEDAKNSLYTMICDLGMDGWQGWYRAMLGITEYMHADMMKMKEREHEGL